MQRLAFILSLLVVGVASCSSDDGHSFIIKPDGGNAAGSETEEEVPVADIEVGKAIPGWQEGVMDIHFINTTTGECMFVIFPDGTQMLIDAASSSIATNSNSNTTNTGIRSRWDPTKTSTRGSQIIADYLRKCMTWTHNNTIDYAVLTHFHGDHMGSAQSTYPKAANGGSYILSGMTEIFDNFNIGTLLDRGYPDYNYPFDMASKADNATSCKKLYQCS